MALLSGAGIGGGLLPFPEAAIAASFRVSRYSGALNSVSYAEIDPAKTIVFVFMTGTNSPNTGTLAVMSVGATSATIAQSGNTGIVFAVEFPAGRAGIETGSLASFPKTISAVNTAKTFDFAMLRNTGSTFSTNDLAASRLISATSITAEMVAAPSTNDLSVQYLEHPGISVQRGSFSMSGSTLQAVSISPVNLSRSFAFLQLTTTESLVRTGDYPSVEFTSNSEITFRRVGTGGITVYWEVIQMPTDTQVISGIASFAVGQDKSVVSVSGIQGKQYFPVLGGMGGRCGRGSFNSDDNLGEIAMRIAFNESAETMDIERINFAGTATVPYFVVVC